MAPGAAFLLGTSELHQPLLETGRTPSVLDPPVSHAASTTRSRTTRSAPPAGGPAQPDTAQDSDADADLRQALVQFLAHSRGDVEALGLLLSDIARQPLPMQIVRQALAQHGETGAHEPGSEPLLVTEPLLWKLMTRLADDGDPPGALQSIIQRHTRRLEYQETVSQSLDTDLLRFHTRFGGHMDSVNALLADLMPSPHTGKDLPAGMAHALLRIGPATTTCDWPSFRRCIHRYIEPSKTSPELLSIIRKHADTGARDEGAGSTALPQICSSDEVPGLARRLRQLLREWCVEHEAWGCLRATEGPIPDQYWAQCTDIQAAGWGGGQVALIHSFFVALNSGSLRTWCLQAQGRHQDLVSWLGDRLFGPGNPITEQGSALGKAPPSASRLWRMYARLDSSLATVTSEALSTAGLPGLSSLDSSPAFGMSPLQAEWLTLLDTTGACSRGQESQNVLLWNLGPHGFEASRLQVEALFLENRSVICLQDLRLPKRKCQEVKEELERRFNYKVFISSAQTGRKLGPHNSGGYHFTTLTALHNDVVSSSSSFVLGELAPGSGRKKRNHRPLEAGRTLCLTATLHSGRRLHILNVYQLTAAHLPRQRLLWSSLEKWIRKHGEDQILLLGDFNSTYPEGRGLREVTWRDVGKYRPAGLSEYTNEKLSVALQPTGLRWRESPRPAQDETMLSPAVDPTDLFSATCALSPDCWASLGIPNLRYTDRLKVGPRTLEPLAPKRHSFSMDEWKETSPPMGLCWEIVGQEKPSHGKELVDDALHGLLRRRLELDQKDLATLGPRPICPDSFVHLQPENLFLRPIAHAPPPSRCFVRAAGHLFVPDNLSGPMRSGYRHPHHHAIQRADALFAGFLSRSGGTWQPASGHTWKNQQGKAATLDHVILWNISSSKAPEVRWTNARHQAAPGTVGMKHDHAQLLISLDHASLPPPPPSKAKQRREPSFDPVLFKSLQSRWQHEATTLIGDPEPGLDQRSGAELYDRHCEDSQALLASALRLQARARASLRRARERTSDRSKQQVRTTRDLSLLEAALKETALPKTQACGRLPRATRRALVLLRLGSLTIPEAEVIWGTSWWRQQLLQEMDRQRKTLATVSKAQQRAAAQTLRRRYHWLFDHGVKGVKKVMGKFGSQCSLSSAKQRCPNGIQWLVSPIDVPHQALSWINQLPLDTTKHQLVAEERSFTIKVHVLTDLYPLLQSCLCLPRPSSLLPPSLVFSEGPWQGENLLTALEFFFQTNAYHPAASCHRCLHEGGVPISTLVPEALDDAPDDALGSLQRTPEAFAEPPLDPPNSPAPGPELSLARSLRQCSAEGRALGCASLDSCSDGLPGPAISDHATSPALRPLSISTRGQYRYVNVPPQPKPLHRRIIHLCEGCLKRGATICEADFRHNRGHVAPMAFLDQGRIFGTRVIPAGESLAREVSPRAFQRYLGKLASRKACGRDGVPAEILKHGPAQFQENLRLLINEVFKSRFKLDSKLLSAKVVLIHKKGDQELLGNYRPIALLTSTYQLINIILADRLQTLAEKYRLFESSQFGFRWLTGVTSSVQKQQWLLKLAKTGDGTLIRIDLDYRNAFNAAGHACLWAILEKFGVPDVQLLKDFYDQAGMEVCVGKDTTAGIFMDTGTAQGSALSPLLFILFINALLRLFDGSGTHHGVKGAPHFNHLAFADDLSLYVASERDADILLQKVKAFEDWSGLQIALSKSFATGILHGSGAQRRVSNARRQNRTHQARMKWNSAPAHVCDLIAMEEDDDDHILRFSTTGAAREFLRCSQCHRQKGAQHFRFPSADDETKDVSTCTSCLAQWLPSGITYNGTPLPVVPGSTPTRFLGIHGDMSGDCTAQIAMVYQKSAAIIAFLQERKLSPRQGLTLVSMTLPSLLRFSGCVVPWSKAQLQKLDSLWMYAYKLACWLPASTASCLLRFPTTLGGRALPTPLGVLCHTVWGHLERCCAREGGLLTLARAEYEESLTSLQCSSLLEVQEALRVRDTPWHQTLHNQFSYACFLAQSLDIQVLWNPFCPDTLQMTDFCQLAQMFLDLGTLLALPDALPHARYKCAGLDASRGTSAWRDTETGEVVTLYRVPVAGKLECLTLHEATALNFPAARDLPQLRALLSGTPLCEVHGTERGPEHLTGTLFLPITCEEADAEASEYLRQGEPSTTGGHEPECTTGHRHRALSGHECNAMVSEAHGDDGVRTQPGRPAIQDLAHIPPVPMESPGSPPPELEARSAWGAHHSDAMLDYLEDLADTDVSGAPRVLSQTPGEPTPLPSAISSGHRDPSPTKTMMHTDTQGTEAPDLPDESAARELLRSFDVNPSFGPAFSWRRSERLARFRELNPSRELQIPSWIEEVLKRFPHLDVRPRDPLSTVADPEKRAAHASELRDGEQQPEQLASKPPTRATVDSKPQLDEHFVSWQCATVSLRDSLRSLQDKEKEHGGLSEKDRADLSLLLRGQTAFDELLGPLTLAGYKGLLDIPRTERGAGRFHFRLPPLQGVSVSVREEAARWLSHRAPKDWLRLNLKAVTGRGTIEPWLKQMPPPAPGPIPDLHLVVNKMTRVSSLAEAQELWAEGRSQPLGSAHSPDEMTRWQAKVDSALAQEDWRTALIKVRDDIGPIQPWRASHHRTPRQTTGPSVTMVDAGAMGRSFLSLVSEHRPLITGLRWTNRGSSRPGGVPLSNSRLTELLRTRCTLSETEWDSTGIRALTGNEVVALECSQINLHGSKVTFFCPKPERIQSTQFKCSINAPSEARLQGLLELWDEGSATGVTALRRALLHGQDLILMPSEWWPRVRCPRRHGWWVRAVTEVQVRLCPSCQNVVAGADFPRNGPQCIGCANADKSTHRAGRSSAPHPLTTGLTAGPQTSGAARAAPSRPSKRLRRMPQGGNSVQDPDSEPDHDCSCLDISEDTDEDWGLASAGDEGLIDEPSTTASRRRGGGPNLRPRPSAPPAAPSTGGQKPRKRKRPPRPAVGEAAQGPRRVVVAAGPQIGLWLRTADPSLVDKPSLQGDTCLAVAQVVECIRTMLSLARTQHEPGEDSLPWNAEWLSSADMGYPLADDDLLRDPHPLVRQYVVEMARRGDDSLLPILQLRGPAQDAHCEICDGGLAGEPCTPCGLCNTAFHTTCLHLFAPGTMTPAPRRFECPKCDSSLGHAMQRFLEDRKHTQAPLPPWERFSTPAKAFDPGLLPEGPGHTTTSDVCALIANPPPGGYVKVIAQPLVHVDDWFGQTMSSAEGISSLQDSQQLLQVSSARWHFLKTVAGQRLQKSLIPLLLSEARRQQAEDLQSTSYSISWRILAAAKSVFDAGVFMGESAVSAPPFFPRAGRGSLTYWESGPDSAPCVVNLAGFSPEDLTQLKHRLQGRADWIILTPPVLEDSPAAIFLAAVGRRALLGSESGKAFRTRGWWKTGSDTLASYSTALECWMAKDAEPEATKLAALGRSMCQVLSHEPPFLDASELGMIYRAGTEAGLLGLHSTSHAVYATDGSLDDGVMGAGVFVVRSARALSARIGRSNEARTSLRVETGASFLSLEHGKDTPAPVFILTDSANHLTEVDNWIGEGKSPTLSNSKDSDILRAILELLHYRVKRGFPTFFIKIRAHRGEPFNEAADRTAGRVGSEPMAPLLWNAPSGRPIFRFKTTLEDGTESSYQACMNDTVKKQIKLQAATLGRQPGRPSGRLWISIGPVKPRKGRELTNPQLSDALTRKLSFSKKEWDSFSLPQPGQFDHILVGQDYYRPAEAHSSITEAFLRRPNCSRELLGRCLADSSFPDSAKRRLIQSVGGQFPCRAKLYQWGIEKSPDCPHCRELESLGHIQSRCLLLTAPRTAAHHLIWRETLLCLSRFSVTTDEAEWVFPSTGTLDNHTEDMIKHILTLPSLGLHWNDLQGEVRQFLHYYTSQFQTKYAHLADKEDPSVFNVPQVDSSDMLAMLRFTSLQLDGSVLRKKNQQEMDDAVKAFLQLRPDGYAINPKSKQVFLLEFTRAMDTDPHWEEYKDAEKARRYAPVLDFFNASRHRAGWTMSQVNFTVGVRGSISTLDLRGRDDRWIRSFTSSLKMLGVTRQADIKRTCKLVAMRIFEAHDLMLRSYYAAKFSSTGKVDFAKIRDSTVAIQHRIRVRPAS